MEPLLHQAQVALRIADVIPFGQQHVGPEIGLVQRREEILRHETHYRQRKGEERDDARNDAPPPAQQPGQQPVEFPVELRIVGIVRRRFDAEHEIAEKRRLRKGQPPAQQQRKPQHDEQRLDDLGNGRRGQIKRQERENGDQRRSQQAPARSIGPVDDGLPPRDAPQHGLLRIVGHHDGVVHQHAHRDDEPRQRGAVETFAQKLHQQKRTAYGEQQRTADQHPGAESHDEHDDKDDDRHRFGEVQDKGGIRLAGNAVFGIKHREVHAHGHLARKAAEHPADLLPGLHHVHVGLGRDADAHRPAAVHAHQRLRRIGVSPLHAGDVAQPVLLARRGDEQLVGDVAEVLIGPVLQDLYFERPGLLLAAVDDRVLLADGPHDRFGADREVGERRKADIDVHHGRLLAEERHLLHAVHGHQRRLDPLRPLAQFGPCESAVDRKAVIDAVHVAEIVGHGNGRSPGRQPGLDVEHLAPQLVPQLRNLRGAGRRIEFDHDLRKSVIGLGGDFMHQPHRLHLAFDRLGNELFDLQRRGSGIGADQRRTFDDERRILLFAQRDEAEGAASKQDEKEKPDDFFIFQRIFGQTHDRITLGFAPARPAAADKRPP